MSRQSRIAARAKLPSTRRGWLILVAAMLVGALVWWLADDGQATQPVAAPSSQLDPLIAAGLASEADGGVVIDGEAVSAVAASLDTTDRARVGYNRDQFAHWTDPDGNGCDARNDVLARDLDEIVWDENGCRVLSGSLNDPYSGETISFTRGADTSSAVQIDHVIPLAAAWTGGADTWTDAERERFANDPVGLEAVSGPENASKSDKLPGEWLPPNTDYHCVYVARVTYLADHYDIAVTELDRSTMVHIAGNC